MRLLPLVLLAALAAPALASAQAPSVAPTGGLVDPKTLRTEPYVDFPRSSDDAFHGQRPLVGGSTNEVSFLVGNPTAAPVAARLRVDVFANQPQGGGQQQQPPPALEEDLALPPRSETPVFLNLTPDAAAGGVQVGVDLQGTGPTWSGRANGGNSYAVQPPVSVRFSSPAPLEGLAPVDQLFGGGGGWSGPLAFAPATQPVRFQALAQNLGPAAVSFRLRLASEQGNGQQAPDVSVASLQPGETRAIDLGTIDPSKLDPEMLRNRGTREFPFSIQMPRADDKPGDFAPTAAAFRLVEGRPVDLAPASLAVGFRHAFAADAFAPATATLGRPFHVEVRARNDGSADEASNPVVVTLDPPYNAEYSVQGAREERFVVSLAPGQESRASLDFTPRVAGRWSLVVQWSSADGPNDQATSLFHVDVPTDVAVQVRQDGPARLDLGGGTRAPVSVTALRDMRDATLRLATGSRLSVNGGGDGPQLAVRGLAAQVVQASPDVLPLGDLRAGETRWLNVTVQSRGTGDFNVVPYVEADGFAYTGLPPDSPQPGAAATAQPASALEVVVAARATPAPLAFAPLAVVALAALAFHLARRKVVR